MKWSQILGLVIWAGMAAAQDLSTSQTLEMVCSLEQPVVGPHEAVKATVLVKAPEPQLLQYRWKAEAGGFITQGTELSNEASGSTVEWNPDGIASGSYTLTVTVKNDEGSFGSCSLVVVVGKEERAAITGPSAAFLGRETRKGTAAQGSPCEQGLRPVQLYAARRSAQRFESLEIREICPGLSR